MKRIEVQVTCLDGSLVFTASVDGYWSRSAATAQLAADCCRSAYGHPCSWDGTIEGVSPEILPVVPRLGLEPRTN